MSTMKQRDTIVRDALARAARAFDGMKRALHKRDCKDAMAAGFQWASTAAKALANLNNCGFTENLPAAHRRQAEEYVKEAEKTFEIYSAAIANVCKIQGRKSIDQPKVRHLPDVEHELGPYVRSKLLELEGVKRKRRGGKR